MRWFNRRSCLSLQTLFIPYQPAGSQTSLIWGFLWVQVPPKKLLTAADFSEFSLADPTEIVHVSPRSQPGKQGLTVGVQEEVGQGARVPGTSAGEAGLWGQE